jgi:hypothetical protein
VRCAVHWLPFERLNACASVVLVGLTPGRGHAAMAFGAAESAIEAGATPRELFDGRGGGILWLRGADGGAEVGISPQPQRAGCETVSRSMSQGWQIQAHAT